MGLTGLNLGGADKDPTTVTNERIGAEGERPESQTATGMTGVDQNEQATVNQTIESIAKNETNTQVNTGEGTRENDLLPGGKLLPDDSDAMAPAATPAEVKGEGLELTQNEIDARVDFPRAKTEAEQHDVLLEQVEATVDAENIAARYSSHPIMRFSIGDYHFDNGLLVLRTEEEAAGFEAMLRDLPVSEQNRIKKLDLQEAERLVREAILRGGGTTQSIDSSTGDRAPSPAVGKGDLIAG